MKAKFISTALLLAAGVCLADATVEQKTQIHFGGALGAVMNVFARDSAKEGVTSGSVVKGDRMLTRTGNTGEIIDQGEEKVYRLDFDRNAYTVKTFAELRREFEEAQERARKNSAKQTKSEKSEGPEYEVEYDTRSTGQKETINGWDTRQQIVTVTVHEKGKKLEESGGFVLTADMWMGPKIAAYREIADFQQRFAQKIYGPAFASDMRQLAAAMAITPAFGKAMKAFNEKGKTREGTPIRSKMTFEIVSGASQDNKQQQQTERDTSPQAAVIGGLLGRMKERRQKDQAESAQSTSPNRSTFFESNSELLKANSTASSADVALPSGFKLR